MGGTYAINLILSVAAIALFVAVASFVVRFVSEKWANRLSIFAAWLFCMALWMLFELSK